MIYWFKRKYSQVKRVLDYLPMIWNGFDWDYKYATDLFAHQLGRMADHFESDRACTLSAGDNAKRIRTTLKLMKLVGDEEYAMEYFDYEDVESYFVPCEGDEDYYSTMETNYISETYDEFFKKYPLTHKRVLNGEGIWGKQYDLGNSTDFKLKRNVAMNIAYLNQERARKTLHKLIERNIQRWWD
jgi:hypothetical protein